MSPTAFSAAALPLNMPEQPELRTARQASGTSKRRRVFIIWSGIAVNCVCAEKFVQSSAYNHDTAAQRTRTSLRSSQGVRIKYMTAKATKAYHPASQFSNNNPWARHQTQMDAYMGWRTRR